MNETPAPDSFQRAPADAVANKADHRKDQASFGVSGGIESDANGQPVGTYSDPQGYSDPNGTVFIDRESHAGAWARFLRDMGA